MNTERKPKTFEDMTKPMEGLWFHIGPLNFHLNFAKSGCWARTKNEGKAREYDWIALRTRSDFEGPNGTKRNIHELIIGPFLIMIGILEF